MATPDVDLDRARTLYLHGLTAAGDGLLDEAERAYRACLELAPRHAATWFNLGLIYKRRRLWQEALVCNQRAVELAPGDDAVWWNLGTAATALRDWRIARSAWRGFGLRIAGGDGPIEGDFGRAFVRLNTGNAGEVVWCRRIDPVRAVVDSVPLPGSQRRWGDVILNDGGPRGERRIDGRVYPVLDELERWQPSAVPTLRVEVEAPAPADVDALIELIEAGNHGAEDWTASVRRPCRSCTEGVIDGDPRHEHGDDAAWSPRREIGIAAPRDEGERLIRWWERRGTGRSAGEIAVVG